MRKILTICLTFLCAAQLSAQDRVDEIRRKLLSCDESSVIVVAHRADWRNYPENSLEAVESAIRMGVDIVELDVQRTMDGVLILMHDHSLDRTTTGHGNISEVTWDYISGLNLKNGCGIATDQKVPTLEQALHLCKDRVMINLDKADRYFAEIFDLLEKTGTTDLIVMKGWQPAERVREQFGAYLDKIIYMPVVNLDEEASGKIVADHLEVLDPVAFEMCFSDDRSAMVGKMGDILKGRSLIWINSLWASLCGGHHDDVSMEDVGNGYEYLIDKLGARIIQTDRPQYLLEYLRLRGLHN